MDTAWILFLDIEKCCTTWTGYYSVFEIHESVFLFQKTEIEKKISIAFSILCHGNLGQLEALFATIFRPQNVYCIYVDDKSPIEYKKAVYQLAAIYKYHFPEVKSECPNI